MAEVYWYGSRYRKRNPGSAKTKTYPLKAVIERVEVPYDRDIEGNVLTLSMDVLECGHRIPTSKEHIDWNSTNPDSVNGPGALRDSKNRRCAKCAKETQ